MKPVSTASDIGTLGGEGHVITILPNWGWLGCKLQ